jgi:hypothetical protein
LFSIKILIMLNKLFVFDAKLIKLLILKINYLSLINLS